jgi:hypothetical protein
MMDALFLFRFRYQPAALKASPDLRITGSHFADNIPVIFPTPKNRATRLAWKQKKKQKKVMVLDWLTSLLRSGPDGYV